MPIGPRKTGSPEIGATSPRDLLATCRKKSDLWGNFVRNHVPQFKPLRHDG